MKKMDEEIFTQFFRVLEEGVGKKKPVSYIKKKEKADKGNN